jgi:hypothetical protein
MNRRLLLLFLLACLMPESVRAQSKYRVAGKVISQLDGHPLPHASLRLLSIPDRNLLQAIASGPDGSFAFADVASGKYELQGDAPGFVLTRYDEHSGFSTAIVTGSSVAADSLVFQLIPKATLSGSITDTSGEPVSPANVYLFRQAEDFGAGPIAPAGSAVTNDTGQYEFPAVAAGTYLLAVQAQPWYAANFNPVEPSGTVGISGPTDPTLNVAYPVMYYPGVADPLQASTIILRSGDTSTDLRLNSVPAIQLTFHNAVQIQRNPRDARVLSTTMATPQLQVDIFGTRQYVPAPAQPVGADLVLGGLAPGDYILNSNMNGRTMKSDRINITHTTSAELPSDQTSVHLRLTLRLPDGSPVPQGTRVALSPPQDRAEAAGGSTNAKGEADVTVPPGDYLLQVTSGGESPGPMLVHQVLAGATAVQANPLRITSGRDSSSSPLAYTVVALPADITVYGIAEKDGKPCPGAFILLVPSDEVHNPVNWRTQQSDLDGSFDLSAVAPGNYLLFAIESGWQLKWREDAVLSRYVPAAAHIQIAVSATHSQRLEQPVAVQPKL